MSDWRDRGEMVRERWRQCFSEYARQNSSQDGPELFLTDIPVIWLADGFLDNPSRFTSEHYREHCRRWLKLHQNYESKNGRPLAVQSRGAATVACYFYDDWRHENQKWGIRDYGCRGEMKNYAARAVVEDFYAWRLFAGIRPVFAEEIGSPTDVEAFIEVVRDLMDKPRGRRYPGHDATVEFLASPRGLVLELPPKPTPK